MPRLVVGGERTRPGRPAVPPRAVRRVQRRVALGVDLTHRAQRSRRVEERVGEEVLDSERVALLQVGRDDREARRAESEQ